MASTDLEIRERNSPFWMLLYFYVLHCCILFADAAVDFTDLTVMEGDHTEMSCAYKGNPMTWRYYRDIFDFAGDIVSSNQFVYLPYDVRFSSYYGSSVYGLAIQNVNLSDHGIYKCAYSSNLVSITALHVVPQDSPTCRIASSNDDGPHRDVTLTCESGITNNFPLIRWFRSNVELKNTTGATLDIETSRTSEEEDVAYTCVIGDSDGRSLPSCSIIPFLSKPTGEITPPAAAVTIGDDASFRCTGSAKSGNANVTWERGVLQAFDGRYALSSGDTQLDLFDLRPSDNNTNLTCIVTASSGTQTTVTAVLQVTKDPGSIGTQNVDRKGDLHDAGNSSIMFVAIAAVAVIVLIVVSAMFAILMKKRNKRQTTLDNHETGTKMNECVDTYAYDEPPRSTVNGQATQYGNVVHIAGGNAGGEQLNEVSLGHGALEPVRYAAVGKSSSIPHDPNGSISYEELGTSSETLGIRAKRQSGYNPDDHADYAEVEKAGKSTLTADGPIRDDAGMYAVVDEKGGKRPMEGNAHSESTNVKSNYERVGSSEESGAEALSDDVYAEPDMHRPRSEQGGLSPVGIGDSDQAAPSKPVPKYAKVNKMKQTKSLDLQEDRYAKPFVDGLGGMGSSGNTIDGNATGTNNDDPAKKTGKPKYAKVNKIKKSKSVDHRDDMYAMPDLNIDEGPIEVGEEGMNERGDAEGTSHGDVIPTYAKAMKKTAKPSDKGEFDDGYAKPQFDDDGLHDVTPSQSDTATEAAQLVDTTYELIDK